MYKLSIQKSCWFRCCCCHSIGCIIAPAKSSTFHCYFQLFFGFSIGCVAMPLHIPLIKFKRCLAFVFHHHHSALFQFNTHKLCSSYCKSTINYIVDDVIIVINHSPSGRNVKVRRKNRCIHIE